jgi:hypothetical protein
LAGIENWSLSIGRQVGVAIEYEGEEFEEGFRADLMVEGKVIVELKSVERVTPAHKKQLLTYLRLMELKPGYLLKGTSAVSVRAPAVVARERKKLLFLCLHSSASGRWFPLRLERPA